MNWLKMAQVAWIGAKVAVKLYQLKQRRKAGK